MPRKKDKRGRFIKSTKKIVKTIPKDTLICSLKGLSNMTISLADLKKYF